jgi:hypothetical protein
MTFPMAAPVPVTIQVSQMFSAALDERGIEHVPEELVVGLDARERTARLASGGSVPDDLFIGIPVHRVPEMALHDVGQICDCEPIQWSVVCATASADKGTASPDRGRRICDKTASSPAAAQQAPRTEKQHSAAAEQRTPIGLIASAAH